MKSVEVVGKDLPEVVTGTTSRAFPGTSSCNTCAIEAPGWIIHVSRPLQNCSFLRQSSLTRLTRRVVPDDVGKVLRVPEDC